jgi:putative glutamine amidotransferase
MRARPVVGLICDRRTIEGQPAHLVYEPYVAAVRDGAEALPLLIPAFEPPLQCADILSAVDGLLFTGSPSNVSPHYYGGAPARHPEFEDPKRDALALPLVRAAVAAKAPLLAICRGAQELNVALGGTLHQHVHEIPGRMDHREREDAPLDVQYGPAHDVTLAQGGMLAGLAGRRTFQVNSLHGQGIDRLAEPLRIEAVAPDGQIEAVSLQGPGGFLLGLQWHPEWHWSQDEVSRAIWSAFAKALRARA